MPVFVFFLQVARESFESGSWIADRSPEHFFEMHKDAWREKWESGGVDLSGDIKLEKLAYSSLYYILSSLPSTDSHRAINAFGGVSSGGLAHGGQNEPGKGMLIILIHHTEIFSIMVLLIRFTPKFKGWRNFVAIGSKCLCIIHTEFYYSRIQ